MQWRVAEWSGPCAFRRNAISSSLIASASPWAPVSVRQCPRMCMPNNVSGCSAPRILRLSASVHLPASVPPPAIRRTPGRIQQTCELRRSSSGAPVPVPVGAARGGYFATPVLCSGDPTGNRTPQVAPCSPGSQDASRPKVPVSLQHLLLERQGIGRATRGLIGKSKVPHGIEGIPVGGSERACS